MPRWDSEWSIRSHISCARALISSGVSPTCAFATAASSAAWRNSRLDPLLLDLDQAAADVLAQLLHAVEAGVDREVVVDAPGSSFSLTSLTVISNDALAPGELLVAVVGRERQLHRARLAGARPEQPLLEARGSGCRRPAR